MNREAMEVREVSQGYDLKAAKSVVPEGYKQTKVGLIPVDWDCKLLGELGQVVRGGSPRPAGSPKYFNGDYIPWLTVASLTNTPKSQQVVSTTSSMLTELGSKHSRVLDEDTLIISNSGATLGVAKILGIRCCANDGIAAIINQKNGNKSFLAHFINTKTKDLHDKVATGNGQPNLNTSSIKNVAVPFPPEEEQQAIATALSDVDVLLEELDCLIAKKRDIKKATMQQLLTGQTRLPGFEGEWETMSLGHFGRCLRGVSYDGGKDLRPYDTGETIRLLRANNVKDAEVVDVDIQYVSAERVSAQQIMQEDDILICMANGSKGLVGKAGVFRRNHSFAYTFGAFMGCFRTDDTKADPGFIFLLFQTYQYREYINLLLAGSSINNLRPSSIELMDFQFPSMEEQKAIASMLQDIGFEVEVLEKRRAKIMALKQAMMQELLTGRVRLL